MFTRRFLNLLHGRLALTKRDVWALALARRWNRKLYLVTKPLKILRYECEKKLAKPEGIQRKQREGAVERETDGQEEKLKVGSDIFKNLAEMNLAQALVFI